MSDILVSQRKNCDYCNSLLAGVPRYQLDRLQSVMNTAAWLIVGAKKQDHIKHVLRDRLHCFPSRSASSSSCVCWHTRHCMDWHRRTSPTSVDQSQPSIADRDSDPLPVVTSLSPPLSRTLAPVHLLWRVLRPGINCRCTYEHGSQSVPSRNGTKVTFRLRWLITNSLGTPRPHKWL